MYEPYNPQPAPPQTPPAAAPQSVPPSGPSSGVQQVPPEFARHIDPNNKIQLLLMQRVDKLTPQDIAACNTIPPAAVAALKKVIPEIAFLLDMIGKDQAIGGAPALPAQSATPRPTTKLANI